MVTESGLTDEKIDALDLRRLLYEPDSEYRRRFARSVESAVRSQDEALLRQAREALRLVSLYVHDFAPDSDAKQFSAALSALNARLGDSKKEMSE